MIYHFLIYLFLGSSCWACVIMSRPSISVWVVYPLFELVTATVLLLCLWSLGSCYLSLFICWLRHIIVTGVAIRERGTKGIRIDEGSERIHQHRRHLWHKWGHHWGITGGIDILGCGGRGGFLNSTSGTLTTLWWGNALGITPQNKGVDATRGAIGTSGVLGSLGGDGLFSFVGDGFFASTGDGAFACVGRGLFTLGGDGHGISGGASHSSSDC